MSYCNHIQYIYHQVVSVKVFVSVKKVVSVTQVASVKDVLAGKEVLACAPHLLKGTVGMNTRGHLTFTANQHIHTVVSTMVRTWVCAF